MKLRFNGLFSLENLKLINEFVETQQTTDCERENTIILLDDIIEVKVMVKKYNQKEDHSFNNSYVDKLIFTKIKEERKMSKYIVCSSFGGSPSVRNESEEEFENYAEAIHCFNSLLELDRKWQKRAERFNNYYYSRIELFENGKLLKANY